MTARAQETSTNPGGYFDSVAAVLDAHRHPIVLVEEAATRWMGMAGNVDRDFDLLIRDRQLDQIVAGIVATGEYRCVEQSLRYKVSGDGGVAGHVPRFLHLDERHPFYSCGLSLWSEAVYKLAVDSPMVQVPGLLARHPSLIEVRFDPSATTTTATTAPLEARQTHSPHPVYIPSIPRLIGALLAQRAFRLANRQAFHNKSMAEVLPLFHLRILIRALRLELPRQRAILFRELDEGSREGMQVLLDLYGGKSPSTLASRPV